MKLMIYYFLVIVSNFHVNCSSSPPTTINQDAESLLKSRVKKSLRMAAQEGLDGWQIAPDDLNLNWCPFYLDDLDTSKPRKMFDDEIKRLNQTYLVDLMKIDQINGTLRSAVSLNATDVTIVSSQSAQTISVGKNVSSESVSIALEVTNDANDLTLTELYQTSSDIQNDLVNLTSLSDYMYENVVILNESQAINGSCCLQANISIEPGNVITIHELALDKDPLDYLAGEETWGIVFKEDADVTFKDEKVFQEDLFVSNLETSSIILDQVVLTSNDSIFEANVSISSLIANNLMISEEESSNSSASFSDFIFITEVGQYNLSNLNLTNARFYAVDQFFPDGLDLLDFLHEDSEQHVKAKIVEAEVISMEGSVESFNQVSFLNGKKLEDFRLMVTINEDVMSEAMGLLNETTNITHLQSNVWDDFMFPFNVDLNFSNCIFDGGVNIKESINDLSWNDLVDTWSDQSIESDVEFDGELTAIGGADSGNRSIVSMVTFKAQLGSNNDSVEMKTMAEESRETVEPVSIQKRSFGSDGGDELYSDDLTVIGTINGLDWNDIHNGFQSLEEIVFNDSVSADECQINFINEKDLTKFVNTSYIGQSFQIAEVKIDDLDVSAIDDSCLNDTNQPGEKSFYGNTIKMNGTINGINPSAFVTKSSDQDFSHSETLIVLKEVEFDDVFSSRVNISILNNFDQSKVMGQNADHVWPDTLILPNGNISSLNSSQFNLKNILTDGGDQEFSASVDFTEIVEFESDVIHRGNDWKPITVRITGGDLDELEVNGSLNLPMESNFIELANVVNATFNSGLDSQSFVFDEISSESGVIYNQSSWKILLKTSQDIVDIMSIEKLTVNGDVSSEFEQDGEDLCLDPIKCLQISSEVTFDGLKQLAFKKKLSFESLKLHEDTNSSVDLDDITLMTKTISKVEFVKKVSIQGDVSSKYDIFCKKPMNEMKFDDQLGKDEQFLGQLNFDDEVLIIGGFSKENEDDELNYRMIETIKLPSLKANQLNSQQFNQFISNMGDEAEINLDGEVIMYNVETDSLNADQLKYWGNSNGSEESHDIVYEIDLDPVLGDDAKNQSQEILDKQLDLLIKTNETKNHIKERIGNLTKIKCTY